jgi:hypothetical protein
MSIKGIVRWALIVLGVSIVGAVVVGMVYAYIGFYVHGDADVACSRDKDGRLLIDLRPNWRVNWVHDVMVWSEGGSDFLWSISNVGPTGKRRIIYGVLPPGSVQVIPENGRPPDPITEDGVFYVKVTVGWDGPFPVSNGVFAKFRAHRDGTIEYLGKSDLNRGVDINFPAKPGNSGKLQ